MPFDLNAAREEGYSDQEILEYLTQNRKFDIAGARTEGYNDAEIIDYLSVQPTKTAKHPMNIQEIRQKYPQYGDLSDQQLAEGLHKKYYSDMPFEDFSKKIGLTTPAPASSPFPAKNPMAIPQPEAAASEPRDISDDLSNISKALAPGGIKKELEESAIAAGKTLMGPGKIAVDVTNFVQNLGLGSAEKMLEWMGAPGAAKKVGEYREDVSGAMGDLADTMKAPGPYSSSIDVGWSMLLGGGSGAGMRKLMERSDILAQVARQAGITESLMTTGIKSGLVAAVGDQLIIDPSLEIIDKKVEASDLSPTTKNLIRGTAPLILGLLSGATIELKLDRMLKNPLAVGFFDGMARKKLTPEQVFERMKSAPDPEDFRFMDMTDEEFLKRTQPPGEAEARGPKSEPVPKTQLQEITDEITADIQPNNNLKRGLDYYRSRYNDLDDDQLAALRYWAANHDNPYIAKRLVGDIDSDIRARKKQTPGKPEPTPGAKTKYEKSLQEYNDYIDTLTPDQRSAVEDLITENPNRPASLLYKMQKRLHSSDIAQEKPKAEIQKEAPEAPISDMAATKTQKKAESSRVAGPRTIRGAIKALGHINFLNFKGELANMPTAVKWLSRKNGLPIDLMEQELRSDGWIGKDETLLEILRDQEVLKRDRISTLGEVRTEGDKAGVKLTDQEQRFKDDMEWEPEEPPEGDYLNVKAQDLPEGAEVTIITGEGATGWDKFKVNRQGNKVILEDGTDIELNKSDIVQARSEDLPADVRSEEPVGDEVFEPKAEYGKDKLILPRRFAEDRAERDLPIGEGRWAKKGYVIESVSDKDLDDILDDAKYYSDPHGGPDQAPQGVKKSSRATVKAIENYRSATKPLSASEAQLEFNFKPKSKEARVEVIEGDEIPPDLQKVTMQTTGYIKGESLEVRNMGDAASLLAHIRKSAQEHFYSIAVDENGKILEIHRYGKGARSSAGVSTMEIAGHILNVPGTKKVYFAHNHPGGVPEASKQDIVLRESLQKTLDLKDISSDFFAIGGTQYQGFNYIPDQGHFIKSTEMNIRPIKRTETIPEKERILRKRVPKDAPVLNNQDEMRNYLDIHYPGKEGFVYLNPQLKPLGWLPYPKGRKMKEGAAAIIAKGEALNARGMIFRTHRGQIPEDMKKLLDGLKEGMVGELGLFDVLHGPQGSWAKSGMIPYETITPSQKLYALESVNDVNILKMHPSTIAGPVGGIAAGVDWEEYEKTGKIQIDPERMFKGALIGVAGGTAFSLGKRSMKVGGAIWDRKVGEPFVNWLRDKANGLIVGEELRHNLGLNRSKEFKDMLREHYRDIERAWNKATDIGKELKKLAPTSLEQKRLMQVIRGGVTASPEMAAKAEKVNKMFEALRKDLQKQKLLEYSRFDKLTRKERAKLRNIIAKAKADDPITEKEFLKRHDLEPIDRPDEPDWAREEVPLKLYEKDGPRSEAEWARSRLNDHYHFGSAQEYAPVYYNTKEGLTPAQRKIVQDEIQHLKVKSRRGNPEGDPSMESMISQLETLLGPGKKARRALRKTRAHLNKQYSHRRLEIPVEIQKQLGKIEEAAFPIAKMSGVQGTDVLKAQLFEEIAKRSDWSIPHNTVTDMPANYVHVQDEAFGELNNMWVRNDIWEDLKEVEDIRSGFIRNWDKMMGLWKAGKVIYNPSTHFRNTMSNAILAYVGDVNPADLKTYRKAFRAVRKGLDDKFYSEAENWGLFNNTFVSTEITKLRDELDVLRDGAGLKSWMRDMASVPATLYEGNEKLFKMAVFIKARESGLDVDKAARKAEKFLFNYGDIPPWVKHMKRWVSPFFTFTYKALPLFAEMAIRKPVKVASLMAMMYGMEEFSRRQLGMSKDELEDQRDLLPDWQKGRTPPGVGPYAHVLWPVKDKWGNNQYWDLSYILPYGNVAEKWGQTPLPLRDIMPSSPVFQTLAAIVTNRDPFTGRDLIPGVMTEGLKADLLSASAEIAKTYADYVWKEAAPPMAPGGHGFNKIKTGFQNTFMGKDVRDWADRPVEFQTAMMSAFFGIKLSPANEKKLWQFERSKRNQISKAFGAEKGRIKTKYKRNEISKKEMLEKIKQLQELKKKIMEGRPKK